MTGPEPSVTAVNHPSERVAAPGFSEGYTDSSSLPCTLPLSPFFKLILFVCSPALEIGPSRDLHSGGQLEALEWLLSPGPFVLRRGGAGEECAAGALYVATDTWAPERHSPRPRIIALNPVSVVALFKTHPLSCPLSFTAPNVHALACAYGRMH